MSPIGIYVQPDGQLSDGEENGLRALLGFRMSYGRYADTVCPAEINDINGRELGIIKMRLRNGTLNEIAHEFKTSQSDIRQTLERWSGIGARCGEKS